MMNVEIYTDGACRNNPGPGGWGVILRYAGMTKELSGAERDTTNNRMELLAAIMGLASLKRKSKVVITTDSQYVQRGMTEWMPNWKAKGRLTAEKNAVKNVDLWQRLDALTQQHEVQWCWVKAHNGHPENERVDELARKAIDQLLEQGS